MKKVLVSVIFAFLPLVATLAVPAKPGQWRTLTLADGRQVRAELKGDEFMHFWQTENGERLVRRGQSFLPAEQTGFFEEARTLRMEREAQRRERLAKTRAIGADHAPYVGKKRGLIVLVQFNDLRFSMPDPIETFGRVINGENFVEGDFKGSVRDYFLSQSQGVFELDFDILGPVTLKNGYAYYGQDGEEAGSDKHPGDMVAEACKAVSGQVNFADYDWDGDYVVDQVFILYAGKGQADGGADETIWPHEWVMERSYGSKPVFGDITVNTYACGPELNGRGQLNGIGTICHEFSHCLGLPDMYDTGDGGNYGMGNWDLMCSGSYNGRGYLPPNYTAYEQAYIGWKTPIELTEDTEVSSMNAIGDGGDIYKLVNDDYPNEYFLLENRQLSGWDAAVGGSGLLVTHVDYEPGVWLYNVVNSVGGGYMKGRDVMHTDHQHLTIVPADGRANRADESSDTYPYNLKDSITNTSSPAFTLYHAKADGSNSLGKAITGIRQNGDGTISFKFRAVDTNKEQYIGGVVFQETFDQCNGIGGNDGNWSSNAGSAAFVADNTGWSVVGEGGADRCAKFGTFVKKGIVVTPKFSVKGTTRLTFRAAPWADESTKVSITVSGSGEVTLSQMTFELTPGRWTDCEALLTGTGEIGIRFTPSNNRFFLDDIKAEVLSSPTAVNAVRQVSEADGRIYDLQGRYAGTDIQGLPHGIYIIGGKKVVK